MSTYRTDQMRPIVRPGGTQAGLRSPTYHVFTEARVERDPTAAAANVAANETTNPIP